LHHSSFVELRYGVRHFIVARPQGHSTQKEIEMITVASVNKYTVPLFGVELVKGRDYMYWWPLPNSSFQALVTSDTMVMVMSANDLPLSEWIFDLVEKINRIR
jgi:hypothetical protein